MKQKGSRGRDEAALTVAHEPRVVSALLSDFVKERTSILRVE